MLNISDAVLGYERGHKPIWDGTPEPITLLVNAGFGDGDTIQYWRFIAEVKNRVSEVILRCNDSFRDLFYEVKVIDKEDPLPDFDKPVHMILLPKLLKSKISGRPYLSPNPHVPPHPAVQELGLLPFLKVGICWAGNPFNKKDHVRSIPVEMFERLRINNMKFFALNQLDPPPQGYFDVRSFMGTWNDTAHLIQAMDLVVSVDTSIAHLAGALGKLVWMLSPDEEADIRWGTGDKTVLYDSMTIFRRMGSWEPTMNIVAEEFNVLVSSL